MEAKTRSSGIGKSKNQFVYTSKQWSGSGD